MGSVVVARGLSCPPACGNPSSLTRDQTPVPRIGRQILYHWTTREVLVLLLYFLAALHLCCCSRAFSSCGARASHCGGFSCCRARALGTRTSVVVVRGLSCSEACDIFPDQGLNPCPLHLADGFLTTAPPGKPSLCYLLVQEEIRVQVKEPA